jgi:ABC-type transport system involved in Fe-S cluster assembly fused permease/ATPase subunit
VTGLLALAADEWMVLATAIVPVIICAIVVWIFVVAARKNDRREAAEAAARGSAADVAQPE